MCIPSSKKCSVCFFKHPSSVLLISYFANYFEVNKYFRRIENESRWMESRHNKQGGHKYSFLFGSRKYSFLFRKSLACGDSGIGRVVSINTYYLKETSLTFFDSDASNASIAGFTYKIQVSSLLAKTSSHSARY